MRITTAPPRLRKALILGMVLWVQTLAHADSRDNVGYARLAAALTQALPTGNDVIFTQVEAAVGNNWMPDRRSDELAGKAMLDQSGGANGISTHATGVAKLFYGARSSLCPGAAKIHNYKAENWISAGFLGTECYMTGMRRPFQPNFDHSVRPWILASPSRVACHSWVGTVHTSEPLRRMDFVIETDEFIQVIGINNNRRVHSLWNSSFNAIAVGRTNGGYRQSTLQLDEVYQAGLTRPLIVAPTNATSSAAPLVASACGLLLSAGQDPRLSTDPVERYTCDRNVVIIYNAERSEVIKAALMAGADRVTANIGTSDLKAYCEADFRSQNGLDTRYGAGQLDIYNSYFIIAAGEQNSREDFPAEGGAIQWNGFDYDPTFGGLGNSNTQATYQFTADAQHRRLYAALVWNIDIAGGEWDNFDNLATLHHLDLALFDISDPDRPIPVAASVSARENTENLWTSLTAGHPYQLLVTARPPIFEWDYAIAWRMLTPADQDQDGMDDDWETEYALDPHHPGDAAGDMDGDGLTNRMEYDQGTRPDHADADRNGPLKGYAAKVVPSPLASQKNLPIPADFLWWFLGGSAALMGMLGVMRLRKREKK